MTTLLLVLLTLQQPNTEIMAGNNRGVGLMGRFQYEDAAEVFAALLVKDPENPVLRTNLAIATLNRQKEGDEDKALVLLDQVLANHPDDVRANYCRGLLLIYAGRENEAMPHFQRVINQQPDAFALYQVAQIMSKRGEGGQALDLYQRAIELDPYFQSAYYGAFRALQQQGKRQEARAMVKQFQRMKNNARAYAFEFKYTRMGPLAMVATFDRQEKRQTRPNKPPFQEVKDLMKGRAGSGEGLSVCDWDQDGDMDLFVPGFQGEGNVLLRNDGGTWNKVADHPLAAVTHVNGITWGDVDNDGRTDAYLLRKGPNILFRQTAEGWEDITAATGVSGGDADTADGAMVDADHDGDLDLLIVNRNAPTELFNNNRDGSWRPLAAEFGLAGDGKPASGLVLCDLDNDRDVDIVVLKETTPHDVYLNDRLWTYRKADGFDVFRNNAVAAALAVDWDADGEVNLITADPSGSLKVWSRHEARWRAQTLDTRVKPGGKLKLGLMDYDGSGAWSLLVQHGDGLTMLNVQGKPVFQIEGKYTTFASVVTTQSGAGPGLLQIEENGLLRYRPPGPGRFPSAVLAFSGKQDQSGGMRSNASGIGTDVAVRVGARWTMATGFATASGPGESLQPMSLGLGGAPRIDFVAMTWSDGVFQTELDLAAGERHRIVEAQRQLASCPVLFAWDGTTYRFISDILGVGGIGFATGRGTYGEPRPYERFLMPADVMKPKDGQFHIKIGEPMEEVCYLDRAALEAWDLPKGWHMALDERMHLTGAPPSGKPVFYRREHQPTQATGIQGRDVTASILKEDHKAAPVGALDDRFLGLLAEDHALTLYFDQALDQLKGDPVLLIDGWVEYPYSQTMFAAWQAGAAYRAPKLEAQGTDGVWHELMPVMGYPAGMPRRMTVPLPHLPSNTKALRISGNLQIYWDRVAVIESEPCLQAVLHQLPLQAAQLARVGFAKRTNGPQMLPQYDYRQRDDFWDTRHMEGNYTQFGDVLPLVNRKDGATAIFGPGEEVHLSFRADLPTLQTGQVRRYVLDTAGWCKDMDLYTHTGDTVAPIPGKRDAAAEKLHQGFNQRYRGGF